MCWPVPSLQDTSRNPVLHSGFCTPLLGSQNRKFAPILIIIEERNAHFFVCKRPGFLCQRLRDFVKMTLTRVIDMTRIESSHSVKNVTRLDSSQHFFNLTRVESESPKIVIRVESLTRVTLSLVESNACSACPFPNFSQCCKVLYMSTNLCNEWDRIVCISFVVGFVPDMLRS